MLAQFLQRPQDRPLRIRLSRRRRVSPARVCAYSSMSANATSAQAAQAAELLIKQIVKETSGAILIGLLFSAVCVVSITT